MKQRLAALNFAFPNLKALAWRIAWHHSHADPIAAVAMEAEMHTLLEPHAARDAGNTEIFVCREGDLLGGWQRAMSNAAAREREVTALPE